ncbi:GNAT family N-acetyltransferase [Egicoccus sp. AB-alg2]|uniref:GNAT family N-acetyltransferase n=1 Tax=Egicoccus sp. AB-alg2 TaxID=3242693 RepID=UPI00359D296A
MMRLRTSSDIPSVADAWEELAERLGGSPFVRPAHVDIHRRAFGGGRLRVVLAERDGDLVGVLPLHEVRGTWRTVTNWHTPASQLLLADDEAVAGMVWLLSRRAPARTELRFVPDEDRDRLQRAAVHVGRAQLRDRILERSPYVRVEGGDFDAYHQQLRTRFRSELRRRRRRLAEHGEVRVVVHDGSRNLDGLLARAFALEASGWKLDTGTAIVTDPPARNYYTGLARWAASQGWLVLAFLEAGGTAIAVDVCIEQHGRHHLLKTGYDPAWHRYAPGQLLREEMIRRAFDHRLSSYEFGGRNDEYKREWTDLTRNWNVVNLHPATLAGRTSLLLQERVRPRAKRLMAAARELRAAVRSDRAA